MNKFTFVAAALAVFSSSFAVVSAAADTRCVTCSKPAVVRIVNPTELPRTAVNTTVEMVLTIDEHGVPQHVAPLHFTDRDVAKRLEVALSQWRFTPQTVNGRAVSTRVVLPIALVGDESDERGPAMAHAPSISAN